MNKLKDYLFCNTQKVSTKTKSMTSKKICVAFYISYYQRMAGANRSLFELIVNLPSEIFPIVIITEEGMVAETYRSHGIRTIILPTEKSLNQFGKLSLTWNLSFKIWLFFTELLPYTFSLIKLFKQFKIDIVHVNDVRGCVLAGLAARLLNIPLVSHLRGELPFSGSFQTIFEVLSNRIITVCDSIQSSLSDNARVKTTTVYNGTSDVSHKGNIIPWIQHLKQESVLVVSCFATVVPFKGYHYLLEAISKLNNRGWENKVVFLCIGDFPEEYSEYQHWLFEMQQKHKISNVTFTGWQSNPFSFYKFTDISVLPSISYEKIKINDKEIEVKGNEGFPRTHLESMSFQIPVVATDIAGVREQVIDNKTGFVVPPADSTALYQALEKLLSDSQLRKSMGQEGKNRVETLFSTESYISGVVKVYKSLW